MATDSTIARASMPAVSSAAAPAVTPPVPSAPPIEAPVAAHTTTDHHITEFYDQFFSGIRKIINISVNAVRGMDGALEKIYPVKTKFWGLFAITLLLSFISNRYLYHKLSLRKMPVASEVLSFVWYLPFLFIHKFLQKNITSYVSLMNRVSKQFEKWFPIESKVASAPSSPPPENASKDGNKK